MSVYINRPEGDRQIRIELDSAEDCTALMSDINPKSDLYKTVRDMRIEFAERSVYSYRFERWMEDYGTPTLTMHLSYATDNDVFKWEQLVMQELRMWVSIGKEVTPSDVDFYVQRRGFTSQMLEFILVCLSAVGLYGNPTADQPETDTSTDETPSLPKTSE